MVRGRQAEVAFFLLTIDIMLLATQLIRVFSLATGEQLSRNKYPTTLQQHPRERPPNKTHISHYPLRYHPP